MRAVAAFVTSAVVVTAMIIIGHALTVTDDGSRLLTDAGPTTTGTEDGAAIHDDTLPAPDDPLGPSAGIGEPRQSGAVPSVAAEPEPVPVITATPVDPDDAIVTREGESVTVTDGDPRASGDMSGSTAPTGSTAPSTGGGGAAPDTQRSPSGERPDTTRPDPPAPPPQDGGGDAPRQPSGGDDAEPTPRPTPTPSPTPTASPDEEASEAATAVSTEAPPEQ